MNYKEIPLKGNEMFNFVGVSINNGQVKFIYWKRNTSTNIKEVIIVLDAEHERVKIDDGVEVVSFKGLNDINKINVAFNTYISILNKRGIKPVVHFIVSNDRENQLIESISRNVDISYDVRKVPNNKLNNNIKEVKEIIAEGSKNIETNNNNINRKITVNGDKAYVNSGMLSIDEEKYLLLQEWKNDPLKSRELVSKTPEEIDRMLLESVTMNKKMYSMNSSFEQGNNRDAASNVAINKASMEDGLVNTELGIVQNGVSNDNKYSAVERDGNNLRVVNTNITSSSINSGGINNSSSSGYVEYNREEKTREVIDSGKVYYLDDEYNIYDVIDDKETLIGKVGYEGYSYDVVNNVILKDNKIIACVDNISNLSRSKSDNKTKVLTKKDDKSNHGFATLPVIMLIISALLLIGSIVLLFVLD